MSGIGIEVVDRMLRFRRSRIELSFHQSKNAREVAALLRSHKRRNYPLLSPPAWRRSLEISSEAQRKKERFQTALALRHQKRDNMLAAFELVHATILPLTLEREPADS